jgi:hypothetical protein
VGLDDESKKYNWRLSHNNSFLRPDITLTKEETKLKKKALADYFWLHMLNASKIPPSNTTSNVPAQDHIKSIFTLLDPKPPMYAPLLVPTSHAKREQLPQG